MEIENFFKEKFAEFLLQNNQQIISNDEVTSLRRCVEAKENELKNSQEDFRKLQKEHQDKERLLLVQLNLNKCSSVYEKNMKLKAEEEVRTLQEKLKSVEEREQSLDATKNDLISNYNILEKQLNKANESITNQMKLNEKIAKEKKDIEKEFREEKIATRWEIVASKDEIERLTMDQFKFLAFVREIVNASNFKGYRSDDTFTVCEQLDSITDHVKSQFERLRSNDLLEPARRNMETENQGAISQGNRGTEINTPTSPLSSRSPTPSDRQPSIVVELRSSERSRRLPQLNSNTEGRSQSLISSETHSEVRSSSPRPKPSENKGKKYCHGIRRLKREIMKRKKHAMWISKRGSGAIEGRWWWWCVCGNLFKRRRALKNHIQYYSFEWKFKCEKCPEIFLYLAKLKAHLTKDHGISNPLKDFQVGCSICGQMFLNRRALGRHRIFVCKSRSGNESPDRSCYKRTVLYTPVYSTPSMISTTETVVVSESEIDQDENDQDENSQGENSQGENSHDENSKDESSHDENSQDENSRSENSHDENSQDENSQDENDQDENSQDENSKDESSQDENSQGENSQDENSKDENDQDEDDPRPSTSFAALHKPASTHLDQRDVLGQIHRAGVTVTDTYKEKEKSRYPCCCTCGNRYQNRFSLRYHIRVLAFGNTLQCINCFKKLSSFPSLKKHMAEKHGHLEYRGNVGCSLCGNQFTSMIPFNTHFEKEHEGKNP